MAILFAVFYKTGFTSTLRRRVILTNDALKGLKAQKYQI
jgi:hypothetical protein